MRDSVYSVEADKYIRSIKNKEKKDYASAYANYLSGAYLQEPGTNLYDCSYMAKQAVRIQLNNVMGRSKYADRT